MGRGSDDTRQRLLDVALRLFCQQGYDATTVADIVGAAGVTPPPLYYHFGSKDGLLRAVVHPLVDALDDVVDRFSGAPSGTESRRRLLREYLEVLVRWRSVVCFLVDDPAVRHHHSVGVRLSRQKDLLQSILVGDDGPSGAVAASAALGAVWRPVTTLDERQLAEYAEAIVDAALAAFVAIADPVSSAKIPIGR